MSKIRKLLGNAGEDLAVEHLSRHGYEIVARNYRTRLGEIDIIARNGNVIVFIEVKTRHSTRRGDPKDALTPSKQRRISMIALQYLKARRCLDARARFDVVAVREVQGRHQIEVVQNAFELAY